MSEKFSLLLPFFDKGSVNCSEIARELSLNVRYVQRMFQKYQLKTPLHEIMPAGKQPKLDTSDKKAIQRV